MIGAALDLLLALSLGCLTLIGLAFMGFSAYLAVFTKLDDKKTTREGFVLFYAGWAVLAVSSAFVMFLIGTFAVQSLR